VGQLWVKPRRSLCWEQEAPLGSDGDSGPGGLPLGSASSMLLRPCPATGKEEGDLWGWTGRAISD
jgi:hypothetical protein